MAKKKISAKASREKQEALAAAEQPADKPKGVIGYIRSIGPAVLVALVIRAFLFEPFSIPSGSMLPTLEIGDYVIVTKFAYGIRVPFTNTMAWQRSIPERGDVMVFDHPIRAGEDLIKRVVGLPGDVITLEDGVVSVNGTPQPRTLRTEAFGVDDYLERERRYVTIHGALFVEKLLPREGGAAHAHFVLQQQEVEPDEGPFPVPEGTVFVLGDNRDNSADSRSMGGWAVPLGNIRGRADLIGFSWATGHKFRTERLFRPIDAGVPQE